MLRTSGIAALLALALAMPAQEAAAQDPLLGGLLGGAAGAIIGGAAGGGRGAAIGAIIGGTTGAVIAGLVPAVSISRGTTFPIRALL